MYSTTEQNAQIGQFYFGWLKRRWLHSYNKEIISDMSFFDAPLFFCSYKMDLIQLFMILMNFYFPWCFNLFHALGQDRTNKTDKTKLNENALLAFRHLMSMNYLHFMLTSTQFDWTNERRWNEYFNWKNKFYKKRRNELKVKKRRMKSDFF